MKYANEASVRTAMSYGCRQVDEFEDDVNGITKVFAVSRDEVAKFISGLNLVNNDGILLQ